MAARVKAIRPARRRPDPGLAADAIDRFLDGLGLPPAARRAGDLADTPRRVAEAWLEDLVDGYGREPAEILAGAIPAAGRDLVAVTGIDYHSVCPHHLLPSRGVAHVAYLPGGRVVGFGQIVKLVDALAHRLVLEEDLARQIADALVEHVGARGAACVLEAEQLCMTVRGERRVRARAHAEAWAGALAKDGPARRRCQAIVARSATPLSPRQRQGERGDSPRPPRLGATSAWNRRRAGPSFASAPAHASAWARARARRSPRTVRQSCSASRTQAAPRAPTCSTSASAMWRARSSSRTSRCASASTSFTSCPNPTTRPPGRYATCATPREGRRWWGQTEWKSMPVTATRSRLALGMAPARTSAGSRP